MIAVIAGIADNVKSLGALNLTLSLPPILTRVRDRIQPVADTSVRFPAITAFPALTALDLSSSGAPNEDMDIIGGDALKRV